MTIIVGDYSLIIMLVFSLPVLMMLQCPPLRERVYRSSHVGSRMAMISSNARSGTYKDWTQLQMDKAVSAVVTDGLSVRRAALQHGVPKSTLGDRISGRVKPGSTSGPPTYLSTVEENELVTFLCRCACVGYAKSCNITSGFRTTGVYPFNREVFSSLDEESPLTKDNGLAFIPLYSPATSRHTSQLREHDDQDVTQDELSQLQDENELEFTESEHSLFERRYARRDELPHDIRYRLWVTTFHPHSPCCKRVSLQQLQTTSVSDFLQHPSPPSRIPVYKPKLCGRVLTSAENLALIQEKELAKEEKKRAAEARKRALEEKKCAKASQGTIML